MRLPGKQHSRSAKEMTVLAAAALGIFLFVQPDAAPAEQQATIAQMTSGAISGFTLDVNWSDIEPAAESYNWSAVDLYALPAVAAGLPLKVGLIAGNDTPAWVQAEVPNTVIQFSSSKPFVCFTTDEPAPWNSNFQTEFLNAQQAVAAHLASIGATVVAVELTGLNHITSELNLVSQSKLPAGSPCPFTDATTQWLSIGYLPSLAESAASSLFAGVEASWPGAQPVLEYVANDAMPKISQKGKSTNETNAELVFDAIVAGVPGVQWNSLSANDNNPIPQIWLNEVAAGAFGVLQTPAYEVGQGGNPCGPADHATSCTDAQFGANLQYGINSGAMIIEVWAGDFEYADQISAANQELLSVAPQRQRH
jgi:hypothetical protein